MERRKTPRKDWIIGRDDVGRSVLEWKVDYRGTQRQDADPSARTYDFLQRLEIPDLALEDEGSGGSPATGGNPYDRGSVRARKLERYRDS